jgi:amino acid transporter
MSSKDWILGKPLATEEEEGERLGAPSGVGVLGLDALASASYGPEALLTVLIPLGLAGLTVMTTLIGAILVVLAVLALSYRQTIAAYPSGGGAYTVAKENLGEWASLLAAAALALDYVLNTAVAVSAGVGALVSAIPALLPHTLALCLAILLLLTVLNLRGVGTTGIAFLVPTYVFIGLLALVIALGVYRAALHGGHPVPLVAPASSHASLATASTWLMLHAFANGCTAMTGVEAVSNGVPLFKQPAVRTARKTLVVIVTLLMVLLAGIAFLCSVYGITATPPGKPGYQSVLSQVVAATVGHGPLYYVTIGSVVTVLALSANTSFADFPRICRLLARDRFLPEPLMHQGRRLAFSYGIIVLSVIAGLLLVIFGGVTEGLIPLFAVGALAAFTMSQVGMIAHWHKQRSRHSRRSMALNLVGALATAATLGIVLLAKFKQGAWISVGLVLIMLLLFREVRRHYDFIAAATATDAPLELAPKPPLAVVPLRRWNAVSLKGLRFALSTTSEIVAVQVLTGDREVDDLTSHWDELVKPVVDAGVCRPRLVVLRSEYRQLFQPLVSFIMQLAKEDPDRQIAVVVSELIEARWYQRLLHNQTATIIRALLLFRGGPQIVVITTPWYLRDWLPERKRLQRLRKSVSWHRRDRREA